MIIGYPKIKKKFDTQIFESDIQSKLLFWMRYPKIRMDIGLAIAYRSFYTIFNFLRENASFFHRLRGQI